LPSKIKSIRSLPGGMKAYVVTLKKILEEVENKNLTMKQLAAWLKHEHNLSGNTAQGYIRVVKSCLGFLVDDNNHIKITQTARDFLKTQNTKLVLDSLQKRVLGFNEVFSILAEGRRLTLEEVHRELVEKCNVNWTSKHQAYWRLKWLMSLGYVDKDHGKYYLTDGQPPPPPPPPPIDDYIKYAKALLKKHGKMSELDTISTLVEPLLKDVLGWNIRDPDEVQREYPIRIGEKTEYVDIALKMNDRPVVFIEAKSVDVPLHNHLAVQPIRYANADGVSWCVLVNGRELRIYNAFWKIKGIESKMFFKLSIDDFKEKIDRLKLLSKESLASGKLDEAGEFEHAKRMISEWLKQKENSIVKSIVELDPSLNEECLRQVIRKIL
jgi:predicted type IV restriction endonuclease